MIKNLVIVESPAKAKTIERFLGKDFTVRSSFGHVMDLSKKGLGVDIEKDFIPIYEISPEKKKVVGELKKAAKEAEVVWLATDEDREGEAISWHLVSALGLDEKTTRRIVFHEITKSAILDAIDNPRQIDRDLVNAQQARRVLDRLVGFELSPLLWKKVKPALSAGRVQSVAVRLIVEREDEIKAFKETSSFKVTAKFTVTIKGAEYKFEAEFPTRFKTREEARKFLEKCIGASYKVTGIETRPSKKSPAPPFTTSTLQQEASRKLGFSVANTMRVAQQLYEEGLITYMRTDSVTLSKMALAMAKEEIIKLYGPEYSKTRQFATKTKGAQEAHEAIRPTYIANAAISGSATQKKLYELIWKRTIASQMSDALTEKTIVNISASTLGGEEFIAQGEVIKFDGFLKVYRESFDDDSDEEGRSILPPLSVGDQPGMLEMNAEQRFTQPQRRLTEASLVKRLEELG
ncbi:MAG: type I DNA topoisomerase, partial [Bacteroidales bacterium]|nr:type I DNA topoisomerase [Bacteroidales bacterium]